MAQTAVFDRPVGSSINLHDTFDCVQFTEIKQASLLIRKVGCDHEKNCPGKCKRRMTHKHYAIEGLVGLALAAMVFFLGAFNFGALNNAAAQRKAVGPEYVGSKSCESCHAAQTRAWKRSHHALAWTLPNEKNVLADFANKTFLHHNVKTLFSKEAQTFFVETDGPDGKSKKYRVVGIAGIEPLQQYLVDTGNGRLQALDVAWDVKKKRWYHLYPDQRLPAGDGLHWTGPYKNWNARCAECHATGFEKNYDLRTKRYQSRSAEIGVGCEACHGPGQAHVAWAKNGKLPDQGSSKLTNKGFTIEFSALTPEREIQQCAGCHARREPFSDGSPQPGTTFNDAYRLSLIRPRLYHADGQIKDEVYVYGSFLQSKMYARGVRCSNCHEPHSATLKAEGNAVCTQCHSAAGNTQFKTLKKGEYDSPKHHFHKPGSDGAQCKSCHMIERTYMGIDGRRDHSFRIPRPDLTAKIGTPNACNDCHKTENAEWAAAKIAKRYPNSKHRAPHFAEVFHKAWQGGTGLELPLLKLAEHDGMSDIVRASALSHLRGVRDKAIVERAAKLLNDKSALVRSSAVVLQRAAPPVVRVGRLVPLLSDPVRSVRMAAAREFLNAPIARLPAGVAAAYRKAISEWRASLQAKTDFPETHMVLGGTALVMRNAAAAQAAFRETVRLDPQRVDAWRMIVRILAAQGKRTAMIKALEAAQAANPDNKELKRLRAQLR
jgi:predicted CXXCH cytochrome family protein